MSYYMGDVVCRLMCKHDFGFLYPLYNYLMGVSIDLDDKYKFSMWEIIRQSQQAKESLNE